MTLQRTTRLKRRLAQYVPPYDKREKHLPGYNFCGPGTNMTRRMRENVQPVNRLDRGAYEHDIAVEPRGPYTAKGHGPALRQADRELLAVARRCLYLKGEDRWACIAVIRAMEALLKTGARGRGLKD